ncbi:MAG: flippase-like domain-containing protein [Coprobacter sp.]|nr:flippase-like domain-containing protein [Coprobacter sp.]
MYHAKVQILFLISDKLEHKISRIIRNTLKFLIPLCCGIAICWALYSKLDMSQIVRILQSEIKYGWVLLSMVVGVLSHVVRAMRWQLQLRALGRPIPFRTLTNAIFGTYAMNLVFPRLGEVWRCGYVNRRENIPFTLLLGSVVSDRLMDTLSVMLLTMAVFFLQMHVLLDFLAQYPVIKDTALSLLTSPYPYLLLVACIGVIVWLFRQKNDHRWVMKVKEMFRNLWAGIRTVLTMRQKGRFLFYTILLWGCYYLQLYFCIFAFADTEYLGALAALSLFVMGSISMGIPVQGGLGPWHLAVMATLTIYGVTDNNVAGSFALVAHGSQMVVIILLGIYTLFSILFEKKRENIPTE